MLVNIPHILGCGALIGTAVLYTRCVAEQRAARDVDDAESAYLWHTIFK